MRVCPVSEGDERNEVSRTVYAVMASNRMREKSSSGGMFGLLAKSMIAKGGYVAGAVYDAGFQSVKHIVSRNNEDVAAMHGSKYLQSNVTDTIDKVRELLSAGTEVLFTGTPCQCAAIKKITGNPENLYTVDIICHGVPSNKMWQGFLNEVAPHQTIDMVNMREKLDGSWNGKLLLKLKSGKKMLFNTDSGYLAAFLSDIGLRESCYRCQYANTRRVGDLTIGDFWGVDALKQPELNDGKGTSIVMVNTQKGKGLMNEINRQCKLCKEVPLRAATAGNVVLTRPNNRPLGRNIFYSVLEESGFSTAFKNASSYKDMTSVKQWDAILFGKYWEYNIGGSLTVYALYETLTTAGMKVAVPDFGKVYMPGPPSFPYKRFYRDMPPATMELMKQTDYLVLASDQIWRPEWGWIGLSFDIAFLNFGDNDVKRVSVATSFGVDETELHPLWNQIRGKVTTALKRFYRVSTREKSGLDILKRFGRNDGAWVIDPVFLCGLEAYDKVIDMLPEVEPGLTIPQHYVFYYMLDSTGPNIITPELRLLDKLCNVLGIPEQRRPQNAVDFLALVKNSEFIVTDSFHGVCYALIYNKPFLCLVNEKRGGARFEIFKDLGLSGRLLNRSLINDSKAVEKLLGTPIDWDHVNAKLEKYRLDAYRFLSEAFQKEFPFSNQTYGTPATVKSVMNTKSTPMVKGQQALLKPVVPPKVMFVTWAHNAEKTLRRTIDSVLAQTYVDFDYIVIDNASVDSTSDIVYEYAQRDSRVHLLINKKNIMGTELYIMIQEQLNSSTASYFVNIDADDVYKPQFLEKSLAFMRDYNLDVVCCGYDFVDEQTKQIKGKRKVEKDLIIEGSGFSTLFPYYHQFMRTIWGKVYKKSILLASNYSTLPHVIYGSDTLFTFEALRNASKVGILSSVLHEYHMNSTSVSYKWDATRAESICALYQTPFDMLIGKCGTVSALNNEFLLLVYMGEMRDAMNVLLKSNISAEERLLVVLDVFSNKYSKQLAAAKRFGALCGNEEVFTQQRKELFFSVAKLLLTVEEVPDRLVEKFCGVGELVCAVSEYAEGWVLFNKLWLKFLIDNGRTREAKEKLDELSDLLPDDAELKSLSIVDDD